jgi:hypothetical protein
MSIVLPLCRKRAQCVQIQRSSMYLRSRALTILGCEPDPFLRKSSSPSLTHDQLMPSFSIWIFSFTANSARSPFKQVCQTEFGMQYCTGLTVLLTVKTISVCSNSRQDTGVSHPKRSGIGSMCRVEQWWRTNWWVFGEAGCLLKLVTQVDTLEAWKSFCSGCFGNVDFLC